MKFITFLMGTKTSMCMKFETFLMGTKMSNTMKSPIPGHVILFCKYFAKLFNFYFILYTY